MAVGGAAKMYHELKAELVELEAAAQEARALAKAAEDARVQQLKNKHHAAKVQPVLELDAAWEAELQAQREKEEAMKQEKMQEREKKERENKARCCCAATVCTCSCGCCSERV